MKQEIQKVLNQKKQRVLKHNEFKIDSLEKSILDRQQELSNQQKRLESLRSRQDVLVDPNYTYDTDDDLLYEEIEDNE